MEVIPKIGTTTTTMVNRIDRQHEVQEYKLESNKPQDSIEISVSARRKLAESADRLTAGSDKTELPVKLLKIKNKMEAGFYDRVDIIQEIADKLYTTIREEQNL